LKIVQKPPIEPLFREGLLDGGDGQRHSPSI